MTNSELLNLIHEHGLRQEDAVEVLRIFEVMSDAKKVDIIDRWPRIAAQIKAHREEIEREKEILFVRSIENVEKELEEYNKLLIRKHAKQDLKGIQI